MKKITTICTFAFMLFLSVSFVNAAMYKFQYCNDAYNIAYGYVKSIDNSNSSIVQTWGECHQSNANVAVWCGDSSFSLGSIITYLLNKLIVMRRNILRITIN